MKYYQLRLSPSVVIDLPDPYQSHLNKHLLQQALHRPNRWGTVPSESAVKAALR
jgi:hypothetical protein